MLEDGSFDIILIIIAISWILYSIIVIIYLKHLSHRYLMPKIKDDIIGNKELKDSLKLTQELENKDTLNILVLSGGGIRGVIPLHILAHIESITGKKTGELFDFFAGSSAGAISASAFAVSNDKGYKFGAKDILNTYERNANLIFSAPWYHQLLTMFGLFAPRFLPDGKIKVLDEYFGDLTLGDLKGNVLIPVYNIETNSLQIIKSWQSKGNNSNANLLIKDVVNGASSPPMLFPPLAMSYKNINYAFIDPAVLLNNPILHVLLYVRLMFPTKKINLVLIGNGGSNSAKYNYKNMFSFGLYGVYQYLFSAPALSSKLYVDFIEEYLQSVRIDNNGINFLRVNSVPFKELSSTNISKANFIQMKDFANAMLDENRQIINKIIATLTAK